MTYTNSKLATYKQLSPNYNPRPYGQAITNIVIHYMAGDLSVEGCGAGFSYTSRGASSNYGIGSDGRIGLYVEEKNRAWTTGSYVIDNKAATIEVANLDNTTGKVTDKALQSLIRLCADICKRNGIKKCTYTGDRSGTLHMHKWYQATPCPGAYLSSKFPYIASEVNKILGGTTPTTTTTTASKPSVTYKVRTKNGWLPEVTNLLDYAGDGTPILDVAMKVGSGSVKYRVHVKGGTWLPYVTGYSTTDHNNGYAGCGKAIDAIQAVYTAPSGKSYRIKYRVAPVGGNYYDYQYNNEKTNGQDGYAGYFASTQSIYIGKFQATIV